MREGAQTWLQSFVHELKQRRVFRVATLYVVLFWPIIQVADILSPALELPPNAMRNLLIAFVIGLPIVLVFAWLFDLNKGGLVRSDGEEQKTRSGQAFLGRTFERGLIVVLLFLIAILAYFQFTRDFQEATPRTTVPSAIAVLPFASFSENREDEFFADGLTEELLNGLSKVQDLRVIARTSSFAYKGVSKTAQQIGYELQVDTILEGSVRRNDVDDTIRVTAQLIDAESGTHLWSQTFDREYRDVFKIQDEIAAAVVGELQLAMGTAPGATPAIAAASESKDAEAMVVVSMGRAELAKRTMQGFKDATRFFERAIELDPSYADAFSGLARSHILLHNYGERDPQHMTAARTAVDRAMAIDADNAEAVATLGLLEMELGEKAQARATFGRAIAMQPNHAMAHMWLGQLVDDWDERHNLLAKAFELDPRSAVAGYNLADHLMAMGRNRDALEVFGQIVEADPYYPKAYELVARLNLASGRLAAAIRNYETSYELEPSAEAALQLAGLYIDMQRFERSDKWLQAALNLASPDDATQVTWTAVSGFAARGERERGEALLRNILARRDGIPNLLNATQAGYFLSDHDATVAAWEASRQLAEVATPGDAVKLDGGTIQAAVAAAHGYAQLESEKANELLDAIDASVEQALARNERGTYQDWYTKAQVAAIRGEHQIALQDLQRAVDQGWRQHWRPQFEPCFAELLELESFKSMMAGLATRIELQADELEFDSYFSSIDPESV